MRIPVRLGLSAVFLACSANLTVNSADISYTAPKTAPEQPVWAGWYLRGDIGFSNQRVDALDGGVFEDTDNHQMLRSDFDAAPFFLAGVGYQFNEHFRADLTGETRGKSDYTGQARYSELDGDPGVWDGTYGYSAEKSERTFLLNGYVDLFNWSGVSTYLGAGAGASQNTIHGFTVEEDDDGITYSSDNRKWQFAWALYAGLAYDVTPNLTVDFGYRYIDLGDASSGELQPFAGPSPADDPAHFRGLSSHDVKLGVRYRFHAEQRPPLP